MPDHTLDETPGGHAPATTVDLRLQSLVLAVAAGALSALGGVAAVIVPSFAAPIALALSIVGVGASAGAWLLALRRRQLDGDLADVHALNSRLRDSAVRKDEFLASVSHELRTPLNVVLGYIDLLLDHSFGPLEPAQRDILHRITKNASNLSHLINDLVDLSRIDAGRMPIEMEVVELGPLFADLSAVMDVLLAGHDVTFESAIAPECGYVHADPDRLKQIVSNLLVNAVKFTERGSIALRATSNGAGYVSIVVSDTGIGIPGADQRIIFEPFRQVHDRERRAPGAGLGLSISSRLATLMGGTLGVESAPGRGSSFTLVLDATTPAVSAPPYPMRKVS
ncbi:MAG: HAMP domain-containing sensor histidine kinase [Candidatus Binatia bacterium]